MLKNFRKNLARNNVKGLPGGASSGSAIILRIYFPLDLFKVSLKLC